MTPTTGLMAQYETRGPVPQAVIRAVPEPTPEPGPGQALLELVAAPINPSDVLTLTGDYGMLPPLPAVGGNEGVGRVAALGAAPDGQPQHLSVGDLVLLPVGAGTWRSHLLADARRLVALPAGADPLQLSMLTVNPATAALLLSEFVALQPGDWVVQNAANSAVGGYLVQLARAGSYQFHWAYTTQDVDGPAGDVFGVLVDGQRLTLSDPGGAVAQAGDFTVTAMQSFSWTLNCTDCTGGTAGVTISGFSLAPVPEPASALLLLAGACGLAAWRRQGRALQR